MIAMPPTMSAARSRISTSSQVMYGSHSAPLRISVSIGLWEPGLSLM